MKPEEAPSCREQKTPTGTGSIPLLCAGCGCGIWDRFVLRVNERPWHERCLRCWECSQPLRGSCFCRQQRLYCRPDYHRLFPTCCSSCRGPLGHLEPVLRLPGGIFHPRCLRCSQCAQTLHRGDSFVLRDGRILCPQHWQYQETARSEDDEENPQNSQKNSQNSQNSQGKDPKRSKRPRTILSSQQRRAFRASFQLSQKPCRKVRESLAAETGLTVRVVQVWFQNQRAKMKKLARRQQQQQQENSRGGISGSGNEDGEGLVPFPFSRIPPQPPLEFPGLGNLGMFPPYDSEGIFQDPPGAVPGSLGEENSQQLLPALLGNPKIPKIPEIPGIPEAGNPEIPEIPGIPEPGNPIEQLYSMQSSYFTS